MPEIEHLRPDGMPRTELWSCRAGINSTRLVDARRPFISIDPAVAKNTGRNDPCPCAHNREPEPLCCRVFLWARLDSNQDLTDYESAALTIELRARGAEG